MKDQIPLLAQALGLKAQHAALYTRYPIVARRDWPTGCIGRVRRACMQDTFARATHSAGRPSAARDDRVSCIQASREQRYLAYNMQPLGQACVRR